MLQGFLTVMIIKLGYLLVWLGYGKRVMDYKKSEGEEFKGLSLAFGFLAFFGIFFGGFFAIAFQDPSALLILAGCVAIYLLWFLYAKARAGKILRLMEAEAEAKRLREEQQRKTLAALQITVSAFSLCHESDVPADDGKTVRGLRFDMQIYNTLPYTVTGFSGKLAIQGSKRSHAFPFSLQVQIPSGNTEAVQNYMLPLGSVDFNIAKTILSGNTASAPTITISPTKIHTA